MIACALPRLFNVDQVSRPIMNEISGHRARGLRHIRQAARHHRVGVTGAGWHFNRGLEVL